MSIFQPIDIESDIEKLRKREEIIKYYRETYWDTFVGFVWEDPDDPFCCIGRAIFKTQRVDQGVIREP